MLNRLKKSLEEKDKGFTLIELLVVVVIIGVLAAIAIPVFLNQRDKAADASVKSDLKNAATEMETSFIDTQTYPTALPGTFKKTGDNVIAVKTGTKTAYCIDGKANRTGATTFKYDSGAGGLLAGTCP